MWVRGLKLSDKGTLTHKVLVAPYVGAWIETSVARTFAMLSLSHPMWVRGLKPENAEYY